MSNKYEEGLKLNLKPILKEKNKKEYLPWASAMGEFMKLYPNGHFALIENERGTYEFGDEKMGYVVKTMVFTGEEPNRCTPCTLPVKNNMNKSILEPSTMDINTALMRCLAKNFSMASGVALTTFAGEEYYQSEIGLELDDLKSEMTKVMTVIWKEYDALKEAQVILGKGKIQDINSIAEAEEKLPKLIELLENLQTQKEEAKKEEVKQTKTTKKEGEK